MFTIFEFLGGSGRWARARGVAERVGGRGRGCREHRGTGIGSIVGIGGMSMGGMSMGGGVDSIGSVRAPARRRGLGRGGWPRWLSLRSRGHRLALLPVYHGVRSRRSEGVGIGHRACRWVGCGWVEGRREVGMSGYREADAALAVLARKGRIGATDASDGR